MSSRRGSTEGHSRGTGDSQAAPARSTHEQRTALHSRERSPHVAAPNPHRLRPPSPPARGGERDGHQRDGPEGRRPSRRGPRRGARRRSGARQRARARAVGRWPRRDAEDRLGCCLDGLRAAGIHAEGVVGDADPLLAIEDALRLFDADEIIVATTSASRSGWLAREAVRRAQARYPRRVRHVVVGHDQGEAAAA